MSKKEVFAYEKIRRPYKKEKVKKSSTIHGDGYRRDRNSAVDVDDEVFGLITPSIASKLFGSKTAGETESPKRFVVDGLDERNQLFELDIKSFESFVDEDGIFVDSLNEVQLKNAIAFYNCYVVFSGTNVVTIKQQPTPPAISPGQFWINIPGILTTDKVNLNNIKKPGTLLYAVARKLNVDLNGFHLVWHKRRPHLYHQPTKQLVEINVVEGKAKGFGDAFSYNGQ